MKMRPLHDKVLIKRLDMSETTEGGIIIPDTAAEKPQQAEVVAVGRGRLIETGEILPLDVEPGDKVYSENTAETRSPSVERITLLSANTKYSL